MDFENEMIVNILNPILVGGCLLWPYLRWALFHNSPIFKIVILRRENIFSLERRSKVVKFAEKLLSRHADRSGKR